MGRREREKWNSQDTNQREHTFVEVLGKGGEEMRRNRPTADFCAPGAPGSFS